MTSKRYAAHYDRLTDERNLASLVAKGGLQSLTKRELALDSEPLTIDPEPKPVLAWVHFYAEAVRVRGLACRWTSRAVGVSFTVGGRQYTTWVWSDAVVPDPAPRAVPEGEKYPPRG